MKGLYIASVVVNGAAADAGLKAGDIITKIDNSIVNSSSELQEAIVIHSPGDKVVVSYKRGDGEKEVTVTLKNKDGGIGIVKKDESNIVTLLGCTFEPITADDMNRHKPVDARPGLSLNDFHVIAENAAFDAYADVEYLAIPQDDAVFHFASDDLCSVADGSIWSDIAVVNDTILADYNGNADLAVDNLCTGFDNNASGYIGMLIDCAVKDV